MAELFENDRAEFDRLAKEKTIEFATGWHHAAPDQEETDMRGSGVAGITGTDQESGMDGPANLSEGPGGPSAAPSHPQIAATNRRGEDGVEDESSDARGNSAVNPVASYHRQAAATEGRVAQKKRGRWARMFLRKH